MLLWHFMTTYMMISLACDKKLHDKKNSIRRQMRGICILLRAPYLYVSAVTCWSICLRIPRLTRGSSMIYGTIFLSIARTGNCFEPSHGNKSFRFAWTCMYKCVIGSLHLRRVRGSILEHSLKLSLVVMAYFMSETSVHVCFP